MVTSVPIDRAQRGNNRSFRDPSRGSPAPSTPVALQLEGRDLVEFDWGREDAVGSAAFWVDQARRQGPTSSFSLGGCLEEEVVACLLGGYGVRYELAAAAFATLKSENLVTTSPPPTAREIEHALRRPLLVERNHVHYRFPCQRANRIAKALTLLAAERPPDDPAVLRHWLLRFDGIGPKTASWIVRNHLGSIDVAIIDVHVHRAGIWAGFFDRAWRLPRDYAAFEAAFLLVAWLGHVEPTWLDLCIWQGMRICPESMYASVKPVKVRVKQEG